MIRLSSEARRWLQGRHDAITLRVSTRHGCCGGKAGVPVAEPGRPRDASSYRRVDVDGISVYLDTELDPEQTYIVRAEGFMGLKRLFVEGAALSAGKE